MTQIIEKNMNIRKRRIMEAFREEESEARKTCLDSAAPKKGERTTSGELKKNIILTNNKDETSSKKLKISTKLEHVLNKIMHKLISSYEEDGPTSDVSNQKLTLTHEPTQDELISTEEPAPDELQKKHISLEEPYPDMVKNRPNSSGKHTPDDVKEPIPEDELTSDELKNKQIKDKEEKIKLREEQSKLIDSKLTILENWEICKRDGLERLVKVVEKLQDMEDEIDKLEDLLWSHNIEIDEEDYEMCFKKYVSENPAEEPLDKMTKSLRPQTPKREKQQTKRIKISATSTPNSKKPKRTDIADKFEANEDGMVVIGPNGTMIAKTALQAINWYLSGAALTRKILVEVFGRETLAFHTLTGKPSPAFMDCDKPMKNQLDPLKVSDIIHLVMEHTQLTSKEVRNAITTKCADENKMFRQREKKRQNAALKLKKQRDN